MQTSAFATAQAPAATDRDRDIDEKPARVTVSVLIKALNEERNIAAAIEHALAAVQPVGGEVVLADACSTDRTVEIASRYPIRIVRLAHAADRCCGAGPQLGYQNSRGEFLYLLDGDMRMRAGFLEQALQVLRSRPEVAGVGGILIEHNDQSLEYQARADRDYDHMKPGEVTRLDGGGLYRRAAIEAVGYLSDRNLHSYEETDLALRLRAARWTLVRIPVPAVDHEGHRVSAYALMLRRWRNGYAQGLGEALRSAWGKPHLPLLWRETWEIKLYLLVCCWWAALAASLIGLPGWLAKGGVFSAIALLPIVAMAWNRRSLAKGVYAVFAWNLSTVATIRGLLRRRRDPHAGVPDTMVLDQSLLRSHR